MEYGRDLGICQILQSQGWVGTWDILSFHFELPRYVVLRGIIVVFSLFGSIQNERHKQSGSPTCSSLQSPAPGSQWIAACLCMPWSIMGSQPVGRRHFPTPNKVLRSESIPGGQIRGIYGIRRSS